MGRFWRGEQDFCRSLLRLDRAIQLAPGSVRALTEKAITLSATAADDPSLQLGEGLAEAESRRRQHKKDALLAEAMHLLAAADRQTGGPQPRSSLTPGFIFDEQGSYPAAIREYRRARQLNQESPASRESERMDERITYNLACALTSAEKTDEALTELESLVNKGPHLKDASQDPQLAPLREGEPGVRFAALLERDRSGH